MPVDEFWVAKSSEYVQWYAETREVSIINDTNNSGFECRELRIHIYMYIRTAQCRSRVTQRV